MVRGHNGWSKIAKKLTVSLPFLYRAGGRRLDLVGFGWIWLDWVGLSAVLKKNVLVQLVATTGSLIRGGHRCFDAPILLRQLLRGAINDEAHMIKPQPGPTKPALTADDGRARLDVF
jgi:hypothetical protein